jgi:hypothetical protein
MRKALIPAFLLVVAAIVLGATVFREQIARAATTPFQQVVVQNTSTNPVPVAQVGTSTTSVSGTVGIDSNKNTVKLDANGNTVNLDSTDATNLASVVTDLGGLKFDGSGNLKTTAPTSSPGAVTQHCQSNGGKGISQFDVGFGNFLIPICQEDFYMTDITASGMDDNLILEFMYDGNYVLELRGGSADGADSYQLDPTHPLHVDEIDAACDNGSTNCNFSLAVLGNSTGS